MADSRWLRMIAFITCLLALFCEAANSSIIASLFPPYALQLGLNETQVGLVASMMDFAILFGQLAISPVITPDTRKLFFVVGILTSGTSVVLFGFSMNEIDPTVFFALCVCCRSTMGIGAALGRACTVPMVIQLYPEKAAICSSVVQMFMGFGGILGAPLGSLLSSIAKYLGFDGISFPFYSFGGFQLCVFISSIISTPSANYYASAAGKKTIPKQQFYSFMAHRNLWFVTMPYLLVYVSSGFRDVAISPYLEETIGVDSSSVGYAMMPVYILFGFSSIMWGYFAQHGNVRFTVATMIVMIVLCPLLLFLPAVFPALENLPYALSSLALIGITISTGFTGYLVFEKVAEFNGFTNVEMNRLTAAAWFNSTRSAGRILGSLVLGGAILQQLQFYHTCLLHASISTVVGMIAVCQLSKMGLFQKSYYTVIEG